MYTRPGDKVFHIAGRIAERKVPASLSYPSCAPPLYGHGRARSARSPDLPQLTEFSAGYRLSSSRQIATTAGSPIPGLIGNLCAMPDFAQNSPLVHPLSTTADPSRLDFARHPAKLRAQHPWIGYQAHGKAVGAAA